MAVDILYTGKGFAPELQSDGGKAMSRLSDFITKAEEIKYKAFKENKDWFLKTQEVDPVAFITTANQDAQNRLMKEYNESSAAIVQKAGGFDKLSGEAQSKILAGKNFLISEQNRMRADQEQYMLEKAMIAKDADTNYSSEEFYRTKEAPYLNGQPYDRTPIQPKAQSIANELIGLKGRFGSTITRNIPSKGAPGFFDTMETTGTREDIAPYITNRVFEEPKYKRDMLERWSALSQAEKDKYLDTDKSGRVDEAERTAGTSVTRDKENPILKFYIDQNWQNALKEEPSGKPTRITTGSSTGGFSEFTGFGKAIKYTPTESRDAGIIGQTKYDSFHDLNVPVQDVNVKQIRVLNPSGEITKPNTGPITADLVGYDDVKDEFIFIATKDYYDFQPFAFGGAKGKDERFAVKRSDLPEKYNDWEIVKDGKRVKVGTIAKSAPTIVKKKAY